MGGILDVGITVSDRNTHACCSRPGLSEKLRHCRLSRRAFVEESHSCAPVVERTPSVTTAGGPSAPRPAR